MENNVARNIRILRESNHLTSEQMAGYLGIKRAAYANYENALRNVPLDVLQKASDIFGCPLSTFFEEDVNEVKSVFQCAFRVDNLPVEDLREIARFKSVAMNYLKMIRLENK